MMAQTSMRKIDFFIAEAQKPHPEGALTAAKTLGVSPEDCAFVGDSPADMGAAKNARMLAVMAGWHDVYHDEVRKLEPDVWVEKPADLIRALAL